MSDLIVPAFRVATLVLLVWLVIQGRSRRLHGLIELHTRVEVLERVAKAMGSETVEAVHALSHDVRANTEVSHKAAEASAQAAHVANAVNEKIADTTRQVAEIHKTVIAKLNKLDG